MYQVLPGHQNFFLMRLISEPARWISLSPEENMNLKEAKPNLEIVNLPINICNFDFH